MFLTFKVQGKPPKKDGSSSMWGKKSEISNLVNLRNSAYEANKINEYKLFEGKLSIDLTIFSNQKQIESMGDLDNFVTGICDGLQSADPRANMSEEIIQKSLISPKKPLLFYSDAKVYEIVARKVSIQEENGFYELTVKEI